MSIRVMSQVWEESTCKGGDLLVLLALADFAHDNGVAFPSVATLSRKARLSERHVQTIISRLVARKELDVKEKAGPHSTNLYRVLLQPAHMGGEEASPPRSEGVNSTAPYGAAEHTEGVLPAAPDPSGPVSGGVGMPGSVVALVPKSVRDAVWSALAYVTETYPETISERSKFGKCVKELATAGATPDEITVRAERYKQKYPGAALTPMALVNHWGALARPVSGRNGKMSPEQIRAMGKI